MLRKAFLDVFEDEIISKSGRIVLTDKFYDIDIRDKSITRILADNKMREQFNIMFVREYNNDNFENMVNSIMKMHMRLLSGINEYDIVSNIELNLIKVTYRDLLFDLMKLTEDESIITDDVQNKYIACMESMKAIYIDMFSRSDKDLSEIILSLNRI
ncbi:MAG: hypothetical protein N4A76_15490 [Firmicutes bacterium]|nr:hypothetical protein [Bacillota bacterium]